MEKKEIILLFAGILILGVFITNIVFGFKYEKYTLDENGIFLEIKNSLNGKLIYSFELKSNCSAGEEILSLGKWDGTKEGCKCYNKIKEGECTDDDKDDKCKDIDSIPPKEYKIINSNYVCVKKSEKTYKQLMESKQIFPKGSECKNDYKSCGIIDTLENILCVPEQDPCPITMADIENSNISLKYNSINNQILSVFKLTENSIPCIHPGENTWKYYYELEPDNKTCTTKILGKLYDDRYEKINQITTTKYELYKDNSIMDYYEYKTKNEIILLYARSFIGFKPEKIDEYDYDDIISKQELPNNCGKAMKIISLIFLGVLLSPIFAICGGGGANFDGEKFFMVYSVLLVIVTIASFFIFFILCIIIYICSLDIQSKLDIKGNDQYANDLIKNLIDDYSINISFSMVDIIVLVIFLVFGLIFLGYLIWEKCLKKDEDYDDLAYQIKEML